MAANDLRPVKTPLGTIADTLDVARKLRHRGAMLLDGNGQHPEAIHAYVTFSHRFEFRITGHEVNMAHDDGAVESWNQDPLEALSHLMQKWSFQCHEPGFTGGFVGVVGYGFTSALEPTLPASAQPSEVPDVCLRLCRDVIVINKRTGDATLWTTDLPGETNAIQRANEIQEELAKPLVELQEIRPADVHWNTSMSQPQFEQEVVRMKERIRTGDLFQANIATQFQATLDIQPEQLFAALRAHNPSPYMALMDFGDHALVSGSPEQLFAVENGIIRARPIAGTRRRGADFTEDLENEKELLTDRKEQAEHTMLVDLVRNDIARVSQPGTVHVPERGSVERYRRVMHLVSRVEGTLRPDTDFMDWLAALFPGGTITGAPKHRACMRIAEAEPVPRGYYTGSAGFLNWDQSAAHWNILIRSMVLKDGRVSIHAGSGIVMGSDPTREWHEAGSKAQALLEAATGQATPLEVRGDEGTVTPHGNWAPPKPPGQVTARVLLVDHYDSFIHNLADHCAALGATVLVARPEQAFGEIFQEFQPTHVILGPGPGWPKDVPQTIQFIQTNLGKIPMLGVCLGHQALAEATNGTVVVANLPVHGEVDRISHNEAGNLAGLASPLAATRYHSLVVDEATLGHEWAVTARLADGTPMAMEHASGMAVGLQFHPESIGTESGLDILFRFLSKPLVVA